jgi:hypothetical protein
MKLTNEIAGEILVDRDPRRFSVEMPIMVTVGGDHWVIRLACHEARRPAALILFQAARLERCIPPTNDSAGEVVRRHDWGLPTCIPHAVA